MLCLRQGFFKKIWSGQIKFTNNPRDYLAIQTRLCYAVCMTKKITMTDMLKAGVHFGHQKIKYQPKMKPYIYTITNNIHIIDLEQTVEKLAQATEFIQETINEKGAILFIGTKRQNKKLIEETAKEVNMPFVVERWLGGTFTNFPVIYKLIQKLRNLETKQDSGEFKKYTKKEQHQIKQEIDRLNKLIGGIKTIDKLPEAIFVADAVHDDLAVKEAREKGVKIVALTDTNADPTIIDYPIPANDDAISSVKLILEQIKNAIKDKQKQSK